MSNANTIATGIYYYPFAESGAPSRQNLEEDTPFKSFVVENKSSQDILVILDGGDLDQSPLKWTCPGGQTLTLEEIEGVFFYSMIIKNEGSLTIGADEIKTQLRNY